MPTLSAQILGTAKSHRSLSVSEFASGYAVKEAASRFWQERLAEHALRLAGAFAMLAGYVHWFLPNVSFGGNSVQMRLFLTVLFVATGVALYAFASRGFRRMLHIDLAERRVIAARLNSKNQSRRRRDVAIADVASIYVRRAEAGQRQATLNIRLKSRASDLVLLAGEQVEVEILHDRLCHDLHLALECGPKRVSRSHTAPTQRPGKRAPKSRRMKAAGLRAN